MRTLRLVFSVIALLALTAALEHPAAAAAAAADDDFHPFIGKYVGDAVFDTAKGKEQRQIEVVIRPTKAGFSLRWTTISEKAKGKTKDRSYYADFTRKRPHVYHTTKKDIDFGNSTGAVYAKIYGKKMTVVAFLISPEGNHEVQTYVRELVPGGMKLTFSREFNGLKTKEIVSMLHAVKDNDATASK